MSDNLRMVVDMKSGKIGKSPAKIFCTEKKSQKAFKAAQKLGTMHGCGGVVNTLRSIFALFCIATSVPPNIFTSDAMN